MRLAAAFGVVFAIFISMLAFSSAQAAETAHYTDIDTAEASALIDKGVKVVDIRRPDEWRETGVIPGSKLITAFDARGQFNPQFPAEFESFVGGNEQVIIICRSGNRSTALSRVLAGRAGYTRIYNASGGMLAWIGGGNHTEPCPVC